MRKRYFFPAIILFFSVIGGYSAKYFTGSQSQFASLNSVFLCLAAIMAGGCLAYEFFGKKKVADGSALSGRFSLLSVAGIAFIAWGWISSAVSGRFWSAFFGMPTSLVGMLTITAIAVIGWYAVRHSDALTEILSLAAPVVLFVTAVIAFIIPIINSADKYLVDAEHLGFGNLSELGLFFVVLSVFTLNMQYPLLKKRFNLELGLRFAIVLFTLMVMYSSRMLTGIVMIIGILIWFLITQIVTSKKARTALGWGGSAAVVMLTVGATYAGLNKLISSEFFDIRLQLWRMAVSILKNRPVFGYGADGFFGGAATVAKPLNWFGGDALHLTDGTTDPHNVLVLMTVSFGLVGLALILSWFGLWIAKSLKNSDVASGYAPAFAASLASAYILLTMPATVNLLPLVAICFALSASGSSQDSSGFNLGKSGATIKKIGTVVALCLILSGTADVLGRIALGPVVYLSGTSFERAIALEQVYGFDPYFAHQVNLAYAYSSATGAALAEQTATFKSLKTESAETGDETNPYYTLVYANAAYKAGFTKTQRGVAASTADRLHQILLEQAAKTFPKQPDINIELAIASVVEGDLVTAKTALAVVEEFGTYGQRIWGVPIKEVRSALDKANQ
ncbi:MAG: O-antigen ligase family protein [Coriobacteriia bacterium]|nr:O-antigen ligase family protein [Coriobacteriia bacterium]